MRQRIIDKTPKPCVVIFETGEELAEGLKKFARDENLAAASFEAIGAFASVKLRLVPDWDSKEYKSSVELSEQVELLSLIGDIALDNVTCPFRKLYPAILMVQVAEDIACSDGSAALDGPVTGGIFA